MRGVVCIILAAGEGRRMKSGTPKVLHRICGQAMIDYPVNLAEEVGIGEILVVIGHKYDLVKGHLGKRVKTLKQEELLGTADAVLRTRSRLRKFDGDVLVLYADMPLIKANTLKRLIRKHRTSRAACTLLTSMVKNPVGYGRIIRDIDSRITRIVEEEGASSFERSIQEINAGIYSFRSDGLFETLTEVRPDNKKKELYLTDVISLLTKRGLIIESISSDDPSEISGINTMSDLAKACAIMRNRILNKLMEEGVRILDPETTYIDLQVKIGRGTVIHPQTYIEGEVEIGKDCRIGPFARIRSGTKLSNNVSIGNFAEVVRSKVGRGSKIKHFSYIGDCIMGRGVNIGAGTVSANYDGKKKYQTVIEDGAFIGSGTILVAPVKIGKNAVTGAGCVVPARKDVRPNMVVAGVPAKVLRKRERRRQG